MLVDWEAIPVVPGPRASSERRSICADWMSAVRVVTPPDAVFDGKMHWHNNELLLVVIAGMVRLVVEERELEAHPGDLVFVPPGSPHATVGVGSKGAVHYEIFAPARTDQLPGWVGKSMQRSDAGRSEKARAGPR
jgi:mannose-6-phosphate isomerase-like protein (cupin superfamily)